MGARRVRITLRVTITVSIVLVTVATASTLLVLDYLASRDALTRFTTVLLDPLATLVGEKSDSFLRPVERAARLSAAQVESAGPSPARFDAFEDDWYSLLAAQPELFYVQYGDGDGNFQLLTRRPDGSLATQRILRGPDGAATVRWRERAPHGRAIASSHDDPAASSYDPRQRPWYRGALAADDVFWTPVYIHAAERRPVITAARRVRDAGRVVGVASVTIALDQLSAFVSGLRIARGGRAFIADRQGHVLAGSGGAAVRSQGDEVRLPSLAEAGGAELTTLAQLPEWRRALDGSNVSVRFAVGQEQFLGVVRPLHLGAHAQTDWLAVVVIPERDFLAPVERGLRRNIMLCGLLTLLFIGLGLLLARAVGLALARVVHETEEIEGLRFDGELPSSRFREIEQIFRTYDRLKAGLRAFGKYVPIRLVRMLLEGEAAPSVGGRVGVVTVFFSDVRDFTASSERMTPEAVAEALGQYFQCLSDIIHQLGGTVDKFIGDGVMAFWNAPRPEPRHALGAVTAALRCREAVAALPQAERLYTRFGLHTGAVMIGNFGARDRFAYTLLGDGVNLAARLEGANKEYGTQILVSEATFHEVRADVLCRQVDRVAVKGKTLATNLYEPLCLIGEASQAQQRLVRDYEAALARYFAGEHATAAALFAQLAERFPGDGATATLLARCRRLADRPPSPSWTSVHELAGK